MADTSVSSFSSGGSDSLPEHPQKEAEKATKGTPSTKQGGGESLDAVYPSGDSVSSSAESKQSYDYGAAPSILSYTQSVDLPKYKMSTEIYKGLITDHELSKDASYAKGTLAAATQANIETIDQLSDDMQDLYDLESKSIGALNDAISDFNAKVKDAAKNKKLEPSGLTLVEATKKMNQQIAAYQNGDITQDEFQKDVDDYNSYLSDWNSAMSGDIDKINTAIDTYNKSIDDFNDEVDVINQQLAKYGATYQMPELSPFSEIPTSGIPPISYDISGPITAPSPISQVKLPPPPPDSSTLQSQMTAPPQTLTSTSSSWDVMAQSTKISAKNIEYTAALLKKFNKQLPVELEIIPRESHFEKSGDLQRTQSPIIQDFFLKINQAMTTSDEAKKLAGSDTFIDQMDTLTKQVYADAVLSAVSATREMLSGQNPSELTIDMVFGVNLAGVLKRSFESGRLQSLMLVLVNSHDPTMNLLQEDKQKIIDAMQLTILLSVPKFISTPFSFKGMEEQLFAQGMGGSGKKIDRTPTSFNHVLQNSFITAPMIAMTAKTLIEQNNFTAEESEDIANRAIGDTIKQLPFQRLADLRSALSSNFKRAGVTNPALAGKLADDITRTLAAFMPLAPTVDSNVSPSFLSHEALQELFDDPSKIEALKNDPVNSGLTDLSPSKIGSLQSELESRFDPEVAKALIQGLATSPRAINDITLTRTLAHALEVSSRIEGGASAEQLDKFGVTDPAFIAAVLSTQSQSMTHQQAFEQVVERILSSGMKAGPVSAKSVAAGVSFISVVDSFSVVNQLYSEMKKRGYPPENAEKSVKQALSIPEAYTSEQAFRTTLAVLLPPDIESSIDQLDLSGLVNVDELKGQIDTGLIAEGFSKAARSDVLEPISVNPPITDRTPADEIAEQLVAITDMSYEQAYAVAKRIEDPESYIDINKVGANLAQHGFDNSITQPILGQIMYLGDSYISVGKFAEMIGDRLGVPIPPEVIESSFRRDKIEEAILSTVESLGASTEESEAMAKRGASDLFNVKTQLGERVWNS